MSEPNGTRKTGREPSPSGRARLAKASLNRLLKALLIILILWAVFVWIVQRQVLFPRWAMPKPGDRVTPPGIEQLLLDVPGGTVEGWFLPADAADAQTPGPAVIFAHGNAELIDDWPTELHTYTRMGVSVLLVEFRGYGRSTGSPSQQAIVDDFTRFRQLLDQRPEVDASRIVYHGRSVGGGVVAQLALRQPPAAMILQSSFTSVPAVARRYLVPRFLIRDPLDVLPAVAQLDRPIFVIHGGQDQIIPVSHAHRIASSSTHTQLIIYPDMGHNSPPPIDYWPDIERFLLDAGIITSPDADLADRQPDPTMPRKSPANAPANHTQPQDPTP